MVQNDKNLEELNGFANYCKICDNELKRLDVMGFKAGDLKDDYWILSEKGYYCWDIINASSMKTEHSFANQPLYKWLLSEGTLYLSGGSYRIFRGEPENLNEIENRIDNETDKEYLGKITELVKKYTELFSDERLPKAFSRLLSEGKDKENLDEDLKEKILFIINAIFEPKLLLYHTQIDGDGRLSSTAIKMSYKLESAFDALKSKVEDFCDEVLKDSETVSFKPEA